MIDDPLESVVERSARQTDVPLDIRHPQAVVGAIADQGQDWGEAEGQPARWVAARMPIAGNLRDGMVAVMDHPSNFRHPAPWRVDYQLGISPSVCIAGEWELADGDEKVFRHRVSVFSGPVEATTIDDVWNMFSEEEGAS